MAVYMDDFASGTTVDGNVFLNAGRAVLAGGGRDITITNNLFVNKHPSVHVDARGTLDWAAAMFRGPNSVLMTRLRAVHFTDPPYSLRYPILHSILDEDVSRPARIVIRDNISYGGQWLELKDGATDSLLATSHNWTDADPGFVSISGGDYRLRLDGPAIKAGYRPPEVAAIGLYQDAYRLGPPHRTKPIPGTLAGGK
jgi:hypothetical protein